MACHGQGAGPRVPGPDRPQPAPHGRPRAERRRPPPPARGRRRRERGPGAVPLAHRDRGRHPGGRLARPGGPTAGPPRRRGGQRPLEAAHGTGGDDQAPGHGGAKPARRHPRPLHRAHPRRAGAALSRASTPRPCSPPARPAAPPSRSTRAPSGATRPRTSCGSAASAGCRFAIDTDAHAPGQLSWLTLGCEQAVAAGVPAGSIVNTLPLDDFLAWSRDRG